MCDLLLIRMALPFSRQDGGSMISVWHLGDMELAFSRNQHCCGARRTYSLPLRLSTEQVLQQMLGVVFEMWQYRCVLIYFSDSENEEWQKR